LISQSKSNTNIPEKAFLTADKVLKSYISQDQSEHGNDNEEAFHEGGGDILTTDNLSKLNNFSPFDKKSNYSHNNDISPVRIIN
jgi:hypothetical protein